MSERTTLSKTRMALMQTGCWERVADEEFSGRGAVKVCEGMSGQIWNVVLLLLHVQLQKVWVCVVDVCYHFSVWCPLFPLDPSQRLLVRSHLVARKDGRRSHQRLNLLGFRHCLNMLPDIATVCPSLSNPWSLLMFLA